MQPPDEANLRDLLSGLHERLSQADRIDPETRRLLVALTRDIEHTLGGRPDPADSAEGAGTRRQSLASLEGIAARFDAEHPALAQTLRQLADLLGKAGI